MKNDNTAKSINKKVKIGITLIIISIPLFLTLPAIPFLSFEGKIKLFISSSVLISAEILFWGGGLLVGKELFTKYKAKLNPKNWFQKKSKTN